MNAAGLGTTTSTGLDIDVVGAASGTHTVVGLDIAVSGSNDKNYAALIAGGNTGFGTTSPDAALVEIEGTTAQLRLGYSGTVGQTITVASSTGIATWSGNVHATAFNGTIVGGAVSGSTATMTGAITTTDNIAGNTATVLANSAITAHGGVGFSLEQTLTDQPASGKGVLYMKDGGGIYWRSNEKTEVELSAEAAGITATAENIFSAQQTFNDIALTSGAAVAWNANTAQVATLTLGHNATMSTATNQKAGGVYILRVTQAAAPKTLAWSTGYKWPANTAPVMTATASAVDIFTFTSDGTYMYGSFSGSQNFT